MRNVPFPTPATTNDLRDLLLHYLDFYRAVIISKTSDLNAEQLQRTTVPSGWTPAGLLHHLANVERRWMQWGFAGKPVDDPWRDSDGLGWVSTGQNVSDLASALEDQAARTRDLVEEHELTDRATPGGRFPDIDAAPQLQWILLHLIQEYARHAGHLDIARELLDGTTGEDP